MKNIKRIKKHITLMMLEVRKTDYCWFWTGRINQFGYGLTGIRGRSTLAHRSLWELLRGKIPEGMSLLHSCDNRRCVNPNHLSPGTQLKNMSDASARGRFPPRGGSLNPRAKLNEAQVAEIILDTESSFVALAKKYGVSDVSIANVKNNKTWFAS